MFTKLTLSILSEWLMDIGFILVFLAIWLRGNRRKSDRLTILRGPFLIVAKSRGFLLAKPLYESVNPPKVLPLSDENRREAMIKRHEILKGDIDEMIRGALDDHLRRKP